MVLTALLVFGLILLAGRVSAFGRQLVSGLACLAGAVLAWRAVGDTGAFAALIAGTGLMSAGSAGLLDGAVPTRFKIGFLVAIGLPWILATWMGARLALAGSATAASDSMLLISGGVLVLYVALIAEEAARARPAPSAVDRATE